MTSVLSGSIYLFNIHPEFLRESLVNREASLLSVVHVKEAIGGETAPHMMSVITAQSTGEQRAGAPSQTCSVENAGLQDGGRWGWGTLPSQWRRGS